MEDLIGVAMAEMLAARLCHELVSPVGAIANGVEILEDEPDFAADAAQLIAVSARIVTRRLQFYREAYGSRSNESRARAVTLEFFEGSKYSCHWPEAMAAAASGLGKLTCNLLLLTSEALPRGGTLTLADAAPAGMLRITGTGEGAHLSPFTPALGTTLAPPVEELTPRTVQACFTKALAERQGLSIAAEQAGANRIIVTVRAFV